MVATMDARRQVIEAVRKLGGVYQVAEQVGLSASMLYQFARPGGPWLGRTTVDRLRAVVELPESVWLAAMGVGAEQMQKQEV